jgi:CBS domain-containing protein
MLAGELITEPVVPLKTSDTGSVALSIMDENRVSHLPIVNNQEFLGVIADSDIYNQNTYDEPVGNHKLSLSGAYVKEDQHMYEVIQTFARLKVSLVPVLDAKNNYLGVITLSNLVNHLAQITSIDLQGGIIILEINEKDYSLSEISGIVESNDAKLLSLYITSFPDSTRLEVTLKINRMDIGPILQTFTRYNYTIKASWSNRDSYYEGILERFDSLMNYLNV